MNDLRLTGAITAHAPIFITRPEQDTALLTMNRIQNQTLGRVHVIPGETIKGLLRAAAFQVCVDGARLSGQVLMNLEQFYRQTVGGLGFVAEPSLLGSQDAIREHEPILSLFGAATPKVEGRLRVEHALAEGLVNASEPAGTGLPPGTRRDGVTAHPENADLLDAEQQAVWSRNRSLVSAVSEANQEVAEARRNLGRARHKQGLDLAPFEAALKVADDNLSKLREHPDFQHPVQRPLPVKQASPAGTVYHHAIELCGASLVEIGLLLATLEFWNQSPRIGGGRTVGYGRIEATYTIEVRSDAPLRRDRRWIAVGQIVVGGQGDVVQTTNPTLTNAMQAWRATETTIRTNTQVFA